MRKKIDETMPEMYCKISGEDQSNNPTCVKPRDCRQLVRNYTEEEDPNEKED